MNDLVEKIRDSDEHYLRKVDGEQAAAELGVAMQMMPMLCS